MNKNCIDVYKKTKNTKNDKTHNKITKTLTKIN